MKKFVSKLRNQKGFTLVEMIVVMAIIGILVALLAPNVATLIKDAQDTSNDAKTKNVMTTLAAYNTKMIKDGASFTGMAAVGGVIPATAPVLVKFTPGATAPDGCVLAVTPLNIAEQVRKLWAVTTVDGGGTSVTAATEVNFIGGADAYLPANVITGNEVMYIYLSKEGNVLGVAYVDGGSQTVKSVVGSLSNNGSDGITIPGTWTNGTMRGKKTTNGIVYN